MIYLNRVLVELSSQHKSILVIFEQRIDNVNNASDGDSKTLKSRFRKKWDPFWIFSLIKIIQKKMSESEIFNLLWLKILECPLMYI